LGLQKWLALVTLTPKSIREVFHSTYLGEIMTRSSTLVSIVIYLWTLLFDDSYDEKKQKFPVMKTV